MSQDHTLYCDWCGEELQQAATNHVRPCSCVTRRVLQLEAQATQLGRIGNWLLAAEQAQTLLQYHEQNS